MGKRSPDLFYMRAGIRALYQARLGGAMVVRVQFVHKHSGQAEVRTCNDDHDKVTRFTVPIRSLLPPLKIYSRPGAWAALHHPFKWDVVDTLDDYADRGVVDSEGSAIKRASGADPRPPVGDPEAMAILRRVWNALPDAEMGGPT